MQGALLAAIDWEPYEALPRLAYADWLDDNGESDLAFAYRWAVRKGRVPDAVFQSHTWFLADYDWNFREACDLPREVFSNLILNWTPSVTRLVFVTSAKAYEALSEALVKLNFVLN